MTSNCNVVLSKRSPGVIVLSLVTAAIDDMDDVTVGASAANIGMTATGSDQIWEVTPDVDVRALWSAGGNTAVTATTGRKLKAGVPYTFAALAGQGCSMMLA
jgi:hypothetical protein